MTLNISDTQCNNALFTIILRVIMFNVALQSVVAPWILLAWSPIMGNHTNDISLLTLSANIRLGWKQLTVTSAIAYNDKELFTTIKCFIVFLIVFLNLHEIFFFRQHNDAIKKCDQTMKDAEYYHGEAESLKCR